VEDNLEPIATNELDRVRAHTATSVLENIDRKTEEQVRPYATQLGEYVTLHRRAGARVGHRASFGTQRVRPRFRRCSVIDKKWLLLPGLVVLPFLFQHAVQGWCPPVSVFRRLGVRTRREINGEKFALKVLRGDFDQITLRSEIDQGKNVRDLLRAVRS
jgi:hypothetical protein